MNKKDIAWFMRQASLAMDYISGNQDRERYKKLMAAVRRALSKPVA